MNITDHLPSWMLATGPADLAVWQWVGLAILATASIVIGRLFAAVLMLAARSMTQRTTTTLDDELATRLHKPFRALVSVAAARAGLPFLLLRPGAADMATDILLGLLAVVLVWGALRTIDVITSRLTVAPWAVARPTSRALLSLLGRIAKVIVLVIAAIGFLGALGLPVASLIAGLGIGGIALAFGAQKTVENLFGAIALGVDQPLREGDFVRVDSNVLGTVESVGLRSTRIRTLDRTVVALPNGKLADMQIETFAVRDRCRLTTTIGVVYETSADQLRRVLAGFERVLRDHPGIWPDDVVVRFAGFGASSLDIEIMAWFKTGDWGQFRTWRQEVLIGFMDVVEAAGSSFAFPTSTVHLVQDKAA